MFDRVEGVRGDIDAEFASTYDELPLWSAPFGLSLLKAVQMKPGTTALDIGSGTGFPLLELAQRLGDTSSVYGIDPWKHAGRRARRKILFRNISNAFIVEGRAENLPFPGRSFDLIVSNNGLNNVEDRDRALRECARVARQGAQMVLSMNLPDTMQEFYDIFETTLSGLGLSDGIDRMHAHILERRPPVPVTKQRIEQVGFRVVDVTEDRFNMRFASGGALLGHFFIRSFFLGRWKEVAGKKNVDKVFMCLEQNLASHTHKHKGIELTIPYACFDCTRI